MKHNPVPPPLCQCASFWTIRGTHKADCPLAAKATSEEAANTGTREQANDTTDQDELETLLFQALLNGMAWVLDYNKTPRIEHVQLQAIEDIEAQARDSAKWRLSQFKAYIAREQVKLLEKVRKNAMALEYTNTLDAARIKSALDVAISQLTPQERGEDERQ